jgi:N-acyl-D-aspartate/D-glutamate deacylase
LITDVHASPTEEFALMREIAVAADAPVSFTLLQRHSAPDEWRTYIREIESALSDGLQIRGQVFPRPVGVMQGLALSLNPFSLRPSYRAIADLPMPEKVRAMRDPEVRKCILAEEPTPDPNPMFTDLTSRVEQMFPLGDPPNYAPAQDQLIGAIAAKAGRTPHEVAYDLLLENEGKAVLYLPASNFSEGVLDAPQAMINHPGTIIGLGDGGAHYGFICDASYPTTMLSYWARDVDPRARIPVEAVVEMMTSRPAAAVGLNDRGVLAPGYKADVNVIDHTALRLHAPTVRYDLPSGGRRISQRADGYVATIVSGEITYRDGEATGARAGRLVRGQKAAPAPC